jgi:hypothetical protein
VIRRAGLTWAVVAGLAVAGLAGLAACDGDAASTGDASGDTAPTAEALVARLDDAGLCRTTAAAPADPPTVVNGTQLRDAWNCEWRGSTGRAAPPVTVWAAATHQELQGVVDYFETGLRQLCGGAGTAGVSPVALGTADPDPTAAADAEASLRIVQGRTWLAFGNVGTDLRRIARVVGGRPRSLHCA